jgi:hypothetical protein
MGNELPAGAANNRHDDDSRSRFEGFSARSRGGGDLHDQGRLAPLRHRPLIYNELGVYLGEKLGNPCDDL